VGYGEVEASHYWHQNKTRGPLFFSALNDAGDNLGNFFVEMKINPKSGLQLGGFVLFMKGPLVPATKRLTVVTNMRVRELKEPQKGRAIHLLELKAWCKRYTEHLDAATPYPMLGFVSRDKSRTTDLTQLCLDES
jgi:hypothetical protein